VKYVTLSIGLILLFSHWSLAQEFRSTTLIQSASQQITVDLSNVPAFDRAALTLHNAAATPVSIPQVSQSDTLLPLSRRAILSQLPATGTDEGNAIQAWRFVVNHRFHYCFSGARQDQAGEVMDPLRFFGAYGFGCCGQSTHALMWLWRQLGYQARWVGIPSFHNIPEVWYGNAWHMLDPDHEVFYRKDDGTIASVAEIIADPTLVARTADSDGKDPVGWDAALMAQLYAQYGPGVSYYTGPAGFNLLPSSNLLLRPHESLTLQSENTTDFVHFYSPSPEYVAPPMTSVNSAQFDWMLSFGDPYWKSQTSTANGVAVVTDASGQKWLANTSSGLGYVQYHQASPFPVSSLVLSAQLAPTATGRLQVSFFDGVAWSTPVTFQPTTGVSSFNVSADVTALARGYYAYDLRLELVGDVKVHKLRITPVVQTAEGLFPALAAGTVNHLSYSDESPQAQARAMRVTVAIPTGQPRIRGVHAESLVPESPAYSLGLDHGAANLVDDDPDSLAYPGSTQLDYVIQLNGTYQVSGISIDWNDFAQTPYVKSWQVLGRSGNQPWQPLAHGGPPGTPTLDVPLDATVTEVRLIADGYNWIGIYDARVFGHAVAPALPSTALMAQSNVPEDPLYSLAQHYQASNLVDGDPTTLAYPGSTRLDYAVALAGLTHLSSARLTWGYFGTNPLYIQSWALLGRTGASQPWVTLAQGGFPNSAATDLSLDFFGTDLRVVARASNWIGLYEFQINVPVPLNLTASANMQEVPNTAFGPAANLVDGNPSTSTYPGGVSPDYTLDPGQDAYIETVQITWGAFGTNKSGAHVEAWRVLGLASDGLTWDVLARGLFPNSTATRVPIQNRYRKLRVAAESRNWIGISEVQVVGTALASALAGPLPVYSQVPEDPVYSLARHYQAANLLDGDPSTLAYPGSTHLDYQVALSARTWLAAAIIDWGTFGTQPGYIQRWALLARSGADQPWVTLVQGAFPNSSTTVVSLDYAATEVRLVADGPNWIGVYELQLTGGPLR
jgi:hypothetical protein